MGDLCKLVWRAFAGLFRSRTSLEAEMLVLRHQLNVLRRKSATRIAFSGVDRMVFAGLYRLAPSVLDALQIAGIGPAFGLTGAGNRDPEEAGPGQRPKFVS
jgi:hypothetical protein